MDLQANTCLPELVVDSVVAVPSAKSGFRSKLVSSPSRDVVLLGANDSTAQRCLAGSDYHKRHRANSAV